MTSLSVCVSYQCVLDRSHCMGHFSPFFTGTGRHTHTYTHTHAYTYSAHLHTCTHDYTHTHTHTHTQTQCFDVNSSGRGVQSTTPPVFPPPSSSLFSSVFHCFPSCDTFNGMSRNPALSLPHRHTHTHTHTHRPCRALSQGSAPLSGENHLSTLMYTHIFTHIHV